MRVVLIVVLLVLGADTAAWWVAIDRLRSAYLLWQTGLLAAGWQVTSGPPAAAGWPLAARLVLGKMRLGQSDPAGFAWSAEVVTLGVSLLHPRTLVVAPAGEQSLSGPGLPAIRFHAASLLVSAPLDGPIRQAQAVAERLSVAIPAGEAVAEHAALDLNWASTAAHVLLSAGPIALPPRHRWGLGQTITTARLDAVAHGIWPGAPAAWRDAGGFVDIVGIALQWGTLDLQASGDARLDATTQPAAALTVTVIDPQSAVAMLAETGAIGHGAATAADALLGLVVLPARLAGRPAVVTLPLRLSAGAVTLGQIPVATIPPVMWASSPHRPASP